MKIATAFSGIGAPEQAAKRVYGDCEIVFACEIDKFARQSYLANYSIDTDHFHRDVTKLDGTKYRGKVDLFVFGSPCQSFSVAGKRGGFGDTRGTLFFEGARLIKEVKPKYFIFENVRGLLSHDKGRTFSIILNTFKEIGYHCDWSVINTKDFGVPQNRERVFVVGFRSYDEYASFEFPKPVELKKSLKEDILEKDVDEKYYLSQKMIECFMGREAISRGYKFRPMRDGIAYCITGKYGNYSTDTYIIMDDGRIRKLTPRETLRLMDFPESFKQVVSNTQMYKQVGNSISVNVLEAIYIQIEKARRRGLKSNLLDFAFETEGKL